MLWGRKRPKPQPLSSTVKGTFIQNNNNPISGQWNNTVVYGIFEIARVCKTAPTFYPSKKQGNLNPLEIIRFFLYLIELH